MRTFSGQPQGTLPRPSPVPTAPVVAAQVNPRPEATAPAAVASVPTAVNSAGTNCPHCGAAVADANAQYCPQCGRTIAEGSTATRLRRILSNPLLIGGLAVVFVMLVGGILLAGSMGTEDGVGGSTVSAGDVVAVPSPTATVVANRATTTPTVSERVRVPGTTNTTTNRSGNQTVNASVNLSNTLSPYIQNAGDDIGLQPGFTLVPLTATPRATSSTATIAPIITPMPGGNLIWQGEGFYKTDPFPLEAGTIRVDLTAGVLTIAQLRDASGKVIGITSAGPLPGSTIVQVAAPGTFQLEITAFGSGPWSVSILKVLSPGPVPTYPAPVVTTGTPPVTSQAPVTSLVTTLPPTVTTSATPTTTTVTTETTQTTQAPTPSPTPTQEPRTFTGNGTAVTPAFTLNSGLALFSYATTSVGTFSVTLIDDGGDVASLIALTNGPTSGSKGVPVPATASYRLNVNATGPWEVSVA